jgi:uncharacterized OsmC-like protein
VPLTAVTPQKPSPANPQGPPEFISIAPSPSLDRDGLFLRPGTYPSSRNQEKDDYVDWQGKMHHYGKTFSVNEEASQMAQKKPVNGINVEQLFSTIELLKQKPELAKFKFRATNKWLEGTHNRATVKDFFGPGREDTSREAVVFDLDEPEVLLGKAQGTNPVEYLLVALSGCLTTSLVAHASAKGIAIKGVESRYEGDIDLRGFLGISPDVKVGYETIRVYFKIEADISDEQKEELVRLAQKFSPVFNSIANPVPVTVQLDKS